MKTEKGQKSKEEGIKRYNLALPMKLYLEVRAEAKAAHTSILEMLKRLIRIGLLLFNFSRKPNTEIIIRKETPEGTKDKEIFIL